MSYFAVLRGILTDTVIDLVRHDHIQLSQIVRQKFVHVEDLNITYEVSFTLVKCQRRPILSSILIIRDS